MKLFRWFVALLPLACGAFIFFLVGWSGMENPVLYLEGNVDVVALLLGILISTPAVAYLWNEHRRHRALDRVREGMFAERNRFLDRLDHEVKNPLATILSGLSSQVDVMPESPARQQLQSLLKQARRVRRLVTDLRKIAQMQSYRLQLEEVPAAGLLGQAVDLVKELPAAQKRQLKLLLQEAPRPLGQIQADRALLLVAVYNLVENAAKFTGPGDIVEVRARRDEHFLWIEVADTGPGIAPEDLPFLGQDLYRGANAQGTPGSGLGLAMAQAIVRRHRGQFAIQSALPHGVEVTIRLPLTQPRSEGTARPVDREEASAVQSGGVP